VAKETIMRRLVSGFIGVVLLVSTPVARSEDHTARAIPGITAADQFPRGCVDCHVNMPDRDMDVRISVQMKQWYEKAPSELLEKAQAAVPSDITLTGRHPVLAAEAFRDIPNSCFACHRESGGVAPPLAPMLHAFHLTGGRENHFLALFGGECTHCHKLNAETARWSLPSGPEN
jgi:hypothetical protein